MSLSRVAPAPIAYEKEDLFWKGFLRDHLDRVVGADRNPHLRLYRRPLFGMDAADDPERWGALDRDETGALASALPPTAASTVPEIGWWYPVLRGKVVEAARGGFGLLALPVSSAGP